MGLAVYYKDSNDLFVEVSTDSDLSTPITTIHEGKEGVFPYLSEALISISTVPPSFNSIFEMMTLLNGILI